MNCSVVFDWKFVVAFGVATASIILVTKMSPADAKEVSIHVIDAYKECAVVLNDNC